MPVEFWLRRTQGGVNRYLFLPAEDLSFNIAHKVIAPVLPGNTSTGVFGGASSQNFLLNLGQYQSRIHVRGNLFDLAASGSAAHMYPTLVAPAIHHISGLQTESARTASTIRYYLSTWVADQSQEAYTNWALGWPEFGQDAAAADPMTQVGTPAVNYRVWEGNITNLDIRESSGRTAFPYSFDFIVGDA